MEPDAADLQKALYLRLRPVRSSDEITAPCFDLCQGREGRWVVGLDQIMQAQPFGAATRYCKTLRLFCLDQGQAFGVTIRKSDACLFPPCVVGEIGAQIEPDHVDLDGATEMDRQRSVGIAVYAP